MKDMIRRKLFLKNSYCKMSIVIPVYNVENYLLDCLDSVCSQVDSSCEIICVEDCSTDNSKSLLHEYNNRHMQQIKIVEHAENKGLSAARNTGIKEAKGDYILFVDSDDMLENGAISEVRKTLDRYGNVDQIFFNMKDMYEEDIVQRINRNSYPNFEGTHDSMELFTYLYQHGVHKVEACGCLYKRSFLLENNLFFWEGIIHEDNLFSFQCMLKRGQVVDINKELYIYRHRKNSIMDLSDIKKQHMSIYSRLTFISEMIKSWNKKDFSNDENTFLLNYMCNMIRSVENMMDTIDMDKNLIHLQDELSAVLHAYINQRNASVIKLSEDQIKKIKSYDKIYIYGAGRLSKDIIHQLEKKDIAIDSVVVTSFSNNRVSLLGHKVVEIKDIDFDKDSSIVILCGKKKTRKDMIEQLQRYGIVDCLEPMDVF